MVHEKCELKAFNLRSALPTIIIVINSELKKTLSHQKLNGHSKAGCEVGQAVTCVASKIFVGNFQMTGNTRS
jgi:hypothetical protein